MGLRVLFVDDEAHIRKAVSAYLERRGFEVALAEDGEEALHRITEVAPDVVVTDVMMPKMDGYELTRALRAHPATAGIPVLILSARKEDSAMLQGYDSGADEYVPKPVQLSVLAAKIEAVARRHAPVAPPMRGVGKIVTFVHAKGGVGATTVLVNAAASWERSPERTFIIDASLPMGDVALLMDLDPRRSVATLTDRTPESLDLRALEEAASTRGNMSVLAAPDSPIDADRVSAPLVRSIIRAAAEGAAVVYVDTAPCFTDVTLAAIDVADAICVVTNPHVSAVRDTKRLLEVLARMGVSDDRIHLVLCRNTAAGVEDRAVGSALGLKAMSVVPYSETVISASDHGRPVVLAHPDSSVALALRDVAEKLRETGAERSLAPTAA